MQDPHGRAWRGLMAELGVVEWESRRVYADLLLAYTHAARHYHNLAHIHDVLAHVDNLAHLARNHAALLLAAWFHDVVYEWDSAENEQRSADYAQATLRAVGVADALVDEVVRLILLTRHRDLPAPDDWDGRILVDADLAGLGYSAEQFRHNAENIRREYQAVPAPVYHANRLVLLEAFLARERIYLTEPMAARYEDAARANLQREIASLKAT